MVALIVAGVIAASSGSSKTIIVAAKNKVSEKRMEIVYDAIKLHVAIKKRIPCPALFTNTKGDPNYGNELIDYGNCSSALNDGDKEQNNNLAYGMVPIDSLNLTPDQAEDGFGTRFSYVVDKRFTRTNVNSLDELDGFELTQSSLAESDFPETSLYGIGVSSHNYDLLPNNNGIIVLISHGENKFGGYDAVSSKKNSDSTNSDELTNHSININNSFVTSSSEVGFDDIVKFSTKAKLVRESGLEEIMCNGDEAKESQCPDESSVSNLSTSNWGNVNYGDEYCFAQPKSFCKKKCGKYGVWSRVNIGLKYCGSEELTPIITPPSATCELFDNYANGNDTYRGSDVILTIGESRTMERNGGNCSPSPTTGNGCLGNGTSPIITCSADNTLTKTNGSAPCLCKIDNNQAFGSFDRYYGSTKCFSGHQSLSTRSGYCAGSNSPSHIYCSRTSSSQSAYKYNPGSGAFYPSKNCCSPGSSISGSTLKTSTQSACSGNRCGDSSKLRYDFYNDINAQTMINNQNTTLYKTVSGSCPPRCRTYSYNFSINLSCSGQSKVIQW
ncbi:MAG: hypothetical protein ACJAUU_000489 [Rickettsiales bacterium]|jgi:hypothetical protein